MSAHRWNFINQRLVVKRTNLILQRIVFYLICYVKIFLLTYIFISCIFDAPLAVLIPLDLKTNIADKFIESK
jgi:hypothetical protein